LNFALNPGDDDANINALLNLTEEFGTTRTLSSPRLHAINNQPAVLTFAENKVFFEVQLSQQPNTFDSAGNIIQGQLSVTTARRSIPLGIIMTILPSVNLETNEVTLNVRPTLTRQVGEVVDPGSAFASEILIEDAQDRFVNTVPIVEVRELDSIMRLRSGQVMVIGGLMEQVGINRDTGVPFLSGVPFLGNAFKGVNKESANRELIIFIKASIVSSEGSVYEADKRVYQKFTDDPRPIAF
jgi:type II secretory pathway component GspD/PulD (secretin)